MHLFRGNMVKDDPKEVAAGKVEEMEETGAKYKMEVILSSTCWPVLK